MKTADLALRTIQTQILNAPEFVLFWQESSANSDLSHELRVTNDTPKISPCVANQVLVTLQIHNSENLFRRELMKTLLTRKTANLQHEYYVMFKMIRQVRIYHNVVLLTQRY